MKNHNEQSGQNGPDCAAATHNTQAKDSEIKSRAYPFVEGYALFFATALKMQHTEHQYRSNLVDHLNYGWSIMLYWHRNQSKYIVVWLNNIALTKKV